MVITVRLTMCVCSLIVLVSEMIMSICYSYFRKFFLMFFLLDLFISSCLCCSDVFCCNLKF